MPLTQTLAVDRHDAGLRPEQRLSRRCAQLDDALCSLAVTRNQCATSTTEASLGTDNPLVAAILSLPNLASIQHALNLVSGEIYASTNGALIDNSRYVREAAHRTGAPNAGSGR